MNIPENTKIVMETYNAIFEHFAPILEVGNSSVAEVGFMDLFLTKLPPHATVVDLGCGKGKHGRYCASKGCRVTGYDISENMIAEAKKHNHHHAMQFLQVADMCHIESDEKFDGVVAMYSLVHLTKEQTMLTLQNIKRNLQPDAVIVLSVYHGDRNGYSPEGLQPDLQQYYRDYTQNELEEMMVSLGFEINHTKLWDDEDEITASNDGLEFGVIGLIATWRGEG